jgi:hypothetical protein
MSRVSHVSLTRRQVACIRAALTQVAGADGINSLGADALVELDGFAWLSDADLEALLDLLTIAEDVTVTAPDLAPRVTALQDARSAIAGEQLALAPLDPRD